MGSGIRAEVSLPTASPSPFDGVVDGSTPIYSVARSSSNGDPETVVLEFIADADLPVSEGVEVVFDYGAKAAYRFKVPRVEASPFAILDRHSVPVSETTIRDGRLVVTFHATDLPTLRSVLDEFRESCSDMQVLRLLQSSSTPEESDLVTVDRSELTERQREVLTAAYDAGYFDHPKGQRRRGRRITRYRPVDVFGAYGGRTAKTPPRHCSTKSGSALRRSPPFSPVLRVPRLDPSAFPGRRIPVGSESDPSFMWIAVVLAAMTSQRTHTFVCPECRRSIEVDDAMRATLLETGCVVCGAPVTEGDIADSQTA